MSAPSSQGLFPAEHRALRELHATARTLAHHWRRLADLLDGDAAPLLREGADSARTLLGELQARTAAYGLYGRPAAQGAGRRLASARGLGDRLLERNQALRTAVLEVQHVVTLLGYLAALAEAREDAALGAWLRGWEGRLRGLEDRARAAVAAQASDPAGAIRPADPGPAGRAGQKLNAAIGSLGEAIDAAAARRRG